MRWETVAAQEAGFKVRRELVGSTRHDGGSQRRYAFVTLEFVPVMLCPASEPLLHRPRLACLTKQHVRGLLRIRPAALQAHA